MGYQDEVAAIVVDEERLLLIPASESEGHYTLPCGKRLEGETAEQAAARICSEIGYEVRTRRLAAVCEGASALFYIFQCEMDEDIPVPSIHTAGRVAWISLEALRNYNVSPAFFSENLTMLLQSKLLIYSNSMK